MPTMIQKFECATCYEVHDDRATAESCSFSHELGIGEQTPVPAVTVLDLWECDGEGCQNAFDSEYYAQECEAGHETADAEGRPNGMIAEMGDRLCAMGLTQAGNIFRKAGRKS